MFFRGKEDAVGERGSISGGSSYRKLRTSDVDLGRNEFFYDEGVDSRVDDSSAVEDASLITSATATSSSFAVDATEKSKIPNAGSQASVETISRLFEMARPERYLMILSAISMAFGSIVSLAVPSFSGKIIDLSISKTNEIDATTITDESFSSSPFRLLMSLLGIMTLSSIVGFFRIWWQATAGHRLVARLRRKLYAAILSQDAAYFDSIQQGDLISRLSSDADLVQSAVTDQALSLLRNLVVAVGAVGLLFYTSVSLALLSVAVLPPIGICARLVGRRMKERQKRVRELHAEATSLAEQALTCVRTVQQFVAERFETYQYNQAINQAHAEGILNTKYRAVFGSFMQLVINLALLAVLGFGGMQVQQGRLSPGDLASFVMYSVMMGTNISSISTLYIDLMKATAAANRVFEVIDRQPLIPGMPFFDTPENDLLAYNEIGSKWNGKEIASSSTNQNVLTSYEMMELGDGEPDKTTSTGGVTPMKVQFEQVDFSYPTRPESKILRTLNLNIEAGQVVAIVGASGQGKSTIASLLTRLYDPQSGDIRINDVSLRDMSPQEARENVGIVVQEPLLFPTSIEANIRYGSPTATEEQVREAAQMAFVLQFADKFPDGLKTLVGSRGTQLSGGQKQRVAVARCILKNPPIVVFDEATSSLDAESESQVQQAIDIACKGRTVIMIAHRLSTIRNSDIIVVLQDGQVGEMGSFDELMKNENGPFRTLMKKQILEQ